MSDGIENGTDVSTSTDPFAPDGANGSAGADPFAPENIGVLHFIIQARIYDVLMALLKESNPAAHRDLLELHMGGSLLGAEPFFNGQFITNLLNADDDKISSGDDDTPKSSETVD